jgi:hypothetical protein
MQTKGTIRCRHGRILRQITALEREVLSFQAGMVSASKGSAAEDTNLAIILAARLSNVWKRVASAIPARS